MGPLSHSMMEGSGRQVYNLYEQLRSWGTVWLELWCGLDGREYFTLSNHHLGPPPPSPPLQVIKRQCRWHRTRRRSSPTPGPGAADKLTMVERPRHFQAMVEVMERFLGHMSLNPELNPSMSWVWAWSWARAWSRVCSWGSDSVLWGTDATIPQLVSMGLYEKDCQWSTEQPIIHFVVILLILRIM